MTLYNLKYWKTKGIEEIPDGEWEKTDYGYSHRPNGSHCSLLKNQATTDRDEALRWAYARRARKIESLERQIEKLRAMEFSLEHEPNQARKP